MRAWILFAALGGALSGCDEDELAPIEDGGVIFPDASSLCGDRILATTEECDSTTFRGHTCATFGYYAGELTCTSTCGLSLAACRGRCGDGIINGEEHCDDAINDGRYGGCTPGCRADSPKCGDGIINGEESCDGVVLGEATCVSEGFEVGRLACDATCSFDRARCRPGRLLSEASVVFTAATMGDGSGPSLAAAGDLDADGYDDLLIGASNTGVTYVIFGSSTLQGRVSLADVGVSVRGARLTLVDPPAFDRRSVSSAGDFNRDGFLDVAIGAPSYRSNPSQCALGAVFVVYGPISGDRMLGGAADLTLEGIDGCVYRESSAGYSIANAGDDLLVGVPCRGQGPDLECAGAVYWMRGRSGLSGVHNLGEADALYSGDFRDGLGSSIRALGDLDTDGNVDFALGAYDNDRAYLMYGPPPLIFAPAVDAPVFSPSRHHEWLSADAAGDVDGDGLDDLLVNREELGGPAGAYLLRGSRSRLGRVIDFEHATAVFSKISGFASGAGAGDLDRDGFADLAIAEPFEFRGTAYATGAVYMFRGSAELSGDIDLSLADVKWVGTATDSEAGTNIVRAGDVNGDGYDDLLIGNDTVIPFNDRPDRESAYLIFGGPDAL